MCKWRASTHHKGGRVAGAVGLGLHLAAGGGGDKRLRDVTWCYGLLRDVMCITWYIRHDIITHLELGVVRRREDGGKDVITWYYVTCILRDVYITLCVYYVIYITWYIMYDFWYDVIYISYIPGTGGSPAPRRWWERRHYVLLLRDITILRDITWYILRDIMLYK